MYKCLFLFKLSSKITSPSILRENWVGFPFLFLAVTFFSWLDVIEISKDFEIVFSVILNDDLNYPPQSSDRKSGR